ncbi:PIN domain-containing protein [bacterium]|nr:MAG: PIN domain-containing protein [bacterium]
MSKPTIFLDSSALIAGIISAQGAARVLLLLAEDGKIIIMVSEQVIAEVERNIARKMPRALPLVREMILRANIQILRDPRPEEVQSRIDWIHHAADVPILVAAAAANVDFLATLNKHHFLDDPEVAQHSGLRIGTPGDALAWVRDWLTKQL